MMQNSPSRLLTKVLAIASAVSLGVGVFLQLVASSMDNVSFYEHEAQTLLMMGAYFALLMSLVFIRNIFINGLRK